MDDKSNICNIVRSPFDDRDWVYEARVVSSVSDMLLPETFKCANLTPVKDQGSRGTCVAMSLSCCKEYQESIDNPSMKGVPMSPNSLYIYRTTEGGGMYCRTAMEILKNKGMCTENEFPYSGTVEPTKIPKKAANEAKNFKIKSYALIETIDGVKKALVEYGPVLIAFPYYNNGSPQFWKKPTINAVSNGGHAVAIVGWDKKGFILRNSWGKNWNGDGHVNYPYDQWGKHWEIWGCIDEEKDYIPEHLRPPEPSAVKDGLLKRLFCIK